MRSTIEDPEFRDSFHKSLESIGSRFDYDKVLHRLQEDDPGIALLLQQPRYKVPAGGHELDLSPKGKFEQCISNFLIDSALVETYRHNNPIEALDSESMRRFLQSNCQIGPFISRDLVSIVNKESALKGEMLSPDSIRDRAFEIGSKALKLFGQLDNDDYRAVLLSEIEAYVEFQNQRNV